jgi:hypothetical protein
MRLEKYGSTATTNEVRQQQQQAGGIVISCLLFHCLPIDIITSDNY